MRENIQISKRKRIRESRTTMRENIRVNKGKSMYSIRVSM